MTLLIIDREKTISETNIKILKEQYQKIVNLNPSKTPEIQQRFHDLLEYWETRYNDLCAQELILKNEEIVQLDSEFELGETIDLAS
jgi:hypothetical protein